MRLPTVTLDAGIRRLGGALAAAALLVAVAAVPVARAADEGSSLPSNDRFRPATCPLGDPADFTAHGIECGVLTVPESRADPAGRSVELAVAYLRGTGPTIAPDPVVFLAGGPGGSALLEIGTWGGSTIRQTHDLILVDQRGTGYSMPSLDCIELLYPAGESTPTEDFVAANVAAAAACRERLVAEGVDLSAYTTNESAADIEDLRIALGIESWNLYGISYGTRLALEVMRDHPTGVRSAVLDSVYPPQVNPYGSAGAAADRAFEALIASCGRDPACEAAYPGLGTRFADAIARFDRGYRGFTFDVPGHTISRMVFSWLYDTQQIEILPALVRAAEQGNSVVFHPAMEPAPVSLIPQAISDGMFLSVECSERFAFADPAAIAADAAAHPRFTTYLDRDWHPAACATWGAGTAEPADVAPVSSDLPTLLFAGELDPVTPPANARLAAETLTEATIVDVPGAGHGVTLIRCPSDIRDAFFLDPGRAPDTSCLATLYGSSGSRYFTDVALNAGLARAAQSVRLNGPTLGHWLLAEFVALVGGWALVAWPIAGLAHLGRRRRGTAEASVPLAAAVPADLAVADESSPELAGEIPVPVMAAAAARGTRLLWLARIAGLAAIGLLLATIGGLAIGLSHIPDGTILRDLGLLRADAWAFGLASIGVWATGAFAVVALAAVLLRAGSRPARFHLVLLVIACLIVAGSFIHFGLV